MKTNSSRYFTYVKGLVFCLAISMVGSALGQSRSKSFKDEISYTNDIQPIVKNFCTTCHAGKNPEGDLVLTSYADVRKHLEKGNLLKRINDTEDPMPPSGRIPKYMRRMFKLWAENGYVEKGKRRKDAKDGFGIDYEKFKAPKIVLVDVTKKGFDFFENMQGHWVGSMNLMGQQFDWMAFDFRAIAPSHVHGIFEGGTIGNLFTSFFITNFNGKRTIMARNGGILNGIYRTSYFVLDQVAERKNKSGKKEKYFRLVDAYGGKDIMWMEITFVDDTIVFNAYTSRFGLTSPARAHMKFTGKRMHPELAKNAAKAVGYPKNVIDKDFAKGLPKPNWGSKNMVITSASYMWEEKGKSLVELGKIAKDPYRIDQMPYLSKLKVSIERNELIKNKKLHLYLSNRPLTNKAGKFITQSGYIRSDLLDGLLLFPEIDGKSSEFTFTYLHPGEYYLTVIADMDADGFPTPGDVTHALQKVVVKPKSTESVKIRGMNVKN